VNILIILFEIPVVTPDTATFDIRKLLHFSCVVCLCVQYDTYERKCVFPHTILTDCFSTGSNL